MTTTGVSVSRTSFEGVRHKVKDRNFVLSFSGLVDVGNIGSMMFVMVNLHGWSINVGFQSFKGIRKIRNGIGICGGWASDDGGGSGSNSLSKNLAAAGGGTRI